MNRILKILCGVACAFAFCFLAIGYAAVQDELTVTGSVSVKAPKKEQYAVYCDDSKTLYFLNDILINMGDPIPRGEAGDTATAVYRNIQGDEFEGSEHGWSDYADDIETVRFLGDIRPVDIDGWFKDCTRLKNIHGMAEHLNTYYVTIMNDTFAGCVSLTKLDLSGFNTESATDLKRMFSGCSSLVTIYASENFVIDSRIIGWGGTKDMFKGCTSLSGGNGTPFDGTKTDATYARIDENGHPGYFTRIGTQNINNLNDEKSENIVETIPLITHIENITWMPSGKLTANNDFGILMTANEGCIFPDTIMVEIEGVGYNVAANGEHKEGEPWFDPEENILYIPGTLLTETTKSVTVMAVAVHNPLPPAGEELTCSCETKCSELTEACEVCKTDITNCKGKEAPAGEELTCTCETKCSELNEACEVCKTDITNCKGTEAPAGEELTCSCKTKCSELTEACEVCKTDITNCKGTESTQPNNPPADEPPSGDGQGEQSTEGTEATSPSAVSGGDVTTKTEETQVLDEQNTSESEETSEPVVVTTADPAILPSEDEEDGEETEQPQDTENDQQGQE